MTYEQLKYGIESSGWECNKIKYITPGATSGHANALKRSKGIDARVYRCPKCGHYHLTTTRLL